MPLSRAGRFPLADWIDRHAGCRYDLGSSGMRGSIPAPPWPVRRPDPEAVDELRAELARHLRVAPSRLFLAHGASEANAWVLGYLARELRRIGQRPVVRVRYPEYPPLFDTARAFGFAVRDAPARASVALLSRPRNPEGKLWPGEEVWRFAEGTRHLLVDETFREFVGVRSMAVEGSPRLWATGSFTKFFAADEARVGFAVAPPGAAGSFGRYVGLASDEVAPGSAAVALELLRNVASIRRRVGRIVDRNLRALAHALAPVALPAAPLYFDRVGRTSGRRLAERCLHASVLVCPGEFFGQPRGVRICLTRRTFPEALRAYLRVRDRPPGPPLVRRTRVEPLDRPTRR